MIKFPLKYLAFYRVKKDFNSIGDKCITFRKGQLLQYQKTISNIHDMLEIVSFLDWDSKETLTWTVRTELIHENWLDYLQPTKL